MLNELKLKWEQRKKNLKKRFDSRKTNFNEKYKELFPKPKLDKDTDHFLVENQGEISQESSKSTRLILKFWLIGLGIVTLGYMLYISLSYIYMVIAAFIISLALEGCIIFWQRLTRSRGIGIFITYLITTIFVLSGFTILIPFFFNRGTELLQTLMSGLLKLQTTLAQLGIPGYIQEANWIPGFFKEELIQRLQNSNSDSVLTVITDNIGSIMSTSSGYVKGIAGQALIFFGNIFSIVADIAIVITLCVFFSIAHYDIKYMLKYIFRHYTNIWPRIDAAYSGITTRLKNQLFLCIFIGIMSYLGLRFLELFGISIPQKGTLALLAGLFEIIPYIGPFLGGLPAAVSALIFSGGWGFLAVGVLYLIIQQGEEKILVPIIMGKSLGVSPLVIFICMLLFGTIMGIFGVILAVPIAVIVSLAFQIPQVKEFNKIVEKSGVKSDNKKHFTRKKLK